MRFTPLIWVAGFIFFVIAVGDTTSVVLANAGADRALHNTYNVVAHFRYQLPLCAAFAIFTATYYLFPKITGHVIPEVFGIVHFCFAFLGAYAFCFPQQMLRFWSMPRHYSDYPQAFAGWNQISSFGAGIFAAGVLVFVAGVYRAIRAGNGSS